MKKPPYFKFYVKDFVFDTVGMSNEELGVYMRCLINSYKSGKIPKTKEDESLFKELKSSFQEYNDICERNRKNRLKSDTNKNDSSTTGARAVHERSTTLVNQEPRTNNQEPYKKKSIKEKEFEEFWKHCPKKVGKGDARKKYGKALEKTTHLELLVAIRSHNEQMNGRDKQYIPNPSTWLNQERWLDETAENTDIDKPDKTLMDFGGNFRAYQEYLNNGQ